jgi:NDP-sugar pyrophosphorylase family protein
MAKQRVSLTLDESLVDRIDSEAERRDVNRSQMVEEIVDSHFKQRGIETAAVFCGDPELKALELHEGMPVLSHILENLEEEGINRVILLTGRNTEIKDSFGSEFNELALEYISEEPSGTAAALSKLKEKVRKPFLALNGHVIADVDLQDMLRVHSEENSTATMALATVENPSSYGVAELKGRKILGFTEKPEKGDEPSRLVNAGTYIFDPEIFDYLNSPQLETVFEELAENGKLSGYIYGGELRDFKD